MSLQSNFNFYLQYRLRSSISSFNIGKSVLYGICFDWDTIDDASPNRSGGAFTHSNHCIVKMDEYQTWTPAYSIFHSRFTSFYRKFYFTVNTHMIFSIQCNIFYFKIYKFIFQIVTMVLGFLFLVPAAIFTAIEPKWNYSDALYYCFISLTTIGLGDFIPGDNIGQHLRPLYKAATTSKNTY